MNLVSPALIALRIFGWIWTEAWPEIASKWLSRRDLVQQGLKKHRGLVVFGSSEPLESPPSQNFDNEKSKVNYKNIWLG